MPTVNLNYQAEAEDIARRRKMAEMLQQQALEPIKQETAGGYVVPISWTQGLAKALQGGVGAYQQAGLKKEAQDLSASRNQALAQALGGMPTGTPGTAGVPEQNFTPEAADFADNPALAPNAQGQVNVPAQAGAAPQAPTTQDYAGWLGKLSSIGPDATAIGSSLMAQQLKKDEAFTLPEGAQRMSGTGTMIANNPKDFRPPVVAPLFKQVGAAGNKVQDQISRDGGVTWNDVGVPTDKFAPPNPNVIHNNTSAPVTPVTIQDPNNPNATIIIDGRTRQVLGAGPRLTETGKSNFKQQTTMQGISSDLQQAEDLLMGQVRDSEGNVTKGSLPTGSGIGSAVDYIGDVFGVTPSGAKEAADLKVVGGKLVQKVPRFEGPQSDKDVALYKQMAADAGNEKITREKRLSAVRRMRELYAGYEDGSRGRLVQNAIGGVNQSTQPPAAPVAPTNVRSAADKILGL